jgi:hypothetical protein
MLKMSNRLAQCETLIQRSQVRSKDPLHDRPSGGPERWDNLPHACQPTLMMKEYLFGASGTMLENVAVCGIRCANGQLLDIDLIFVFLG